MLDEMAVFVTAISYIVSGLLIGTVGFAETREVIRLWKTYHVLDSLRVMWMLLGWLFCVVEIWRAFVWIDWTVFDMELLGPIAQRWPYELVLSIVVLGVLFYVSYLYWEPRFRRRRSRA